MYAGSNENALQTLLLCLKAYTSYLKISIEILLAYKEPPIISGTGAAISSKT
jgi:hypothetical protein